MQLKMSNLASKTVFFKFYHPCLVFFFCVLIEEIFDKDLHANQKFNFEKIHKNTHNFFFFSKNKLKMKQKQANDTEITEFYLQTIKKINFSLFGKLINKKYYQNYTQ